MQLKHKSGRSAWAGRNLYTGILLSLFGVVGTLEALRYPIGTMARMGPGFYPLSLSVILVILGVVVAITPVRPSAATADDEPAAFGTLRARAKGMMYIAGGMIAFIILGEYGGLVPATFVMVTVAAMGDEDQTWKSACLLALGTTIVGTAIFAGALQLQLPMFRWG